MDFFFDCSIEMVDPAWWSRGGALSNINKTFFNGLSPSFSPLYSLTCLFVQVKFLVGVPLFGLCRDSEEDVRGRSF